MTTADAARRWADVWSRAWPAADTEAIVGLYAPDAAYYSHPFRARTTARAYLEEVFGEQAAAECRFGEPLFGHTVQCRPRHQNVVAAQ